jgi:glycosyltransferase involved in cell wall biosynthesis
MEYKYRITVFTPTYNRAYVISNLYKSLCSQSFKNFEWLVVDDGSSDDTESLFSNWISNSDFEIRYYKTKNGGKHRAINKGMELANGEIFFTMDSDDELTSDALEKIDGWFNEIKDTKELKGVTANKGVSASETVNCFFSSQY